MYMNKITINNLTFTLFEIDDDIIIKVYCNIEKCGQGLISISQYECSDGYHLYKWFDENEIITRFPLCVDAYRDDDDDDDDYRRIKVVGVDIL